MLAEVTDQDAQALGSRARRTVVPHPQRWRSPQEAGWSERSAPVRRTATAVSTRSGVATRTSPVAPIEAAPAFTYGRPVRRFRNLMVYAATPRDGACWTEAKRAELEIFAVRNGWASIESQAAGEVLDYVPYEARSEIFVATKVTDASRPVAVARMIWGTSDLTLEEQFLVTAMHGLEPEWKWLLDLIGLDRVAEWATLGAVGSNLSPMFALWSAIYRSARARGVDYWVQSIVEVLFSGYRDGFKMPMIQVGGREVVVGAESIPTVLSLEESGIGPMMSWDPTFKREMFGSWVDRRRSIPDPDDFELVRSDSE